MKKIKSSNHRFIKINKLKKNRFDLFLDDYNKAIIFYIDYLWNNKIMYEIKVKSSNEENKKTITKTLDIKNDLLDCPSFISTKSIIYESDLSARALKCASTQACGIISSTISDRKELRYILSKSQDENEIIKIKEKIKLKVLNKPIITNFKAELNSIVCKVINLPKINNKCDLLISLYSLGKKYGKINLFSKHHYNSRKLEKGSKILKSFLISKKSIDIRWEYEVKEKENGITVGADTGINSVITLSDGQLNKIDIHNHTLNNILQKIVRKKKGSNAFHKALAHRDNFIGYSINNLNLSNIKQINLENISNFRYKKNVGKFLNYGGEALIRSKLIDFAEDNGVRVNLQSSPYRSQRCSCCGFVCRENRNGIKFCCMNCGFKSNSDLNASKNHEQILPDSMFLLHFQELPKKFFWTAKGFFNLESLELTVSNTNKR